MMYSRAFLFFCILSLYNLFSAESKLIRKRRFHPDNDAAAAEKPSNVINIDKLLDHLEFRELMFASMSMSMSMVLDEPFTPQETNNNGNAPLRNNRNNNRGGRFFRNRGRFQNFNPPSDGTVTTTSTASGDGVSTAADGGSSGSNGKRLRRRKRQGKTGRKAGTRFGRFIAKTTAKLRNY